MKSIPFFLILFSLLGCASFAPGNFADSPDTSDNTQNSGPNQPNALDELSDYLGSNPPDPSGDNPPGGSGSNPGGPWVPPAPPNPGAPPAPPSAGGSIDVSGGPSTGTSSDPGSLGAAPVIILCMPGQVCSAGSSETTVSLWFRGTFSLPAEFRDPSLGICEEKYPPALQVQVWRSDDFGHNWSLATTVEADTRTGQFFHSVTDAKKVGTSCKTYLQYKVEYQKDGMVFKAASPILKCESETALGGGNWVYCPDPGDEPPDFDDDPRFPRWDPEDHRPGQNPYPI